MADAATVQLERGAWEPSTDPPRDGQLGLLLMRGLIVRRVEVGEGTSAELLGRGDLLRPWEEDTSSFCRASFEVLERATLTPLSSGRVHTPGQWPGVAANVAALGLRRSRALAADAAIASIVGVEERLLTMLWQLAERWGKAKPDGVHLGIRLPHRLLAELVGARRPSVTTALNALRKSGRIASTPGGRWVLLGDPPS